MSTCSVVHNIQEYWINFASWRKKGRKKKNTTHETAPITGSEWQRLKETSGNYPFQIPFSKQGQVAHSHFQLWLDYCGWRLQIISEQPVPIFDCSKSKNKQTKKNFYNAYFYISIFQFVPAASCLVNGHHWEEPSFIFFLSLSPTPGIYMLPTLDTEYIFTMLVCWIAQSQF